LREDWDARQFDLPEMPLQQRGTGIHIDQKRGRRGGLAGPCRTHASRADAVDERSMSGSMQRNFING